MMPKERKETVRFLAIRKVSLPRRQPRAGVVATERGTCFVPTDRSRRQAAMGWWSYNNMMAI